MVWYLLTKGIAEEEVASRLRMTGDELTLARLRMTAYTASVSNDVLKLAVNEDLLAIAKTGNIRTAIGGALKAERIVVSSQGVVLHPVTNEPITEPDHAMRLEGVRTYSRVLKDNAPVGPAVQVNTAINNSNTQTNIIGGGRSFEARRRAAAERRGVAEAEVVDEEDADEPLDGEVEVEFDDPDEVDDTPDEDEE